MGGWHRCAEERRTARRRSCTFCLTSPKTRCTRACKACLTWTYVISAACLGRYLTICTQFECIQYLFATYNCESKIFSHRFQELPTDEIEHSDESYQILQQQFEVTDDGRSIQSVVNRRKFRCGEFSCPTLQQISQSALNYSSPQPRFEKPPDLGRNDVRIGTITFSHLATEDVMQLHGDPANHHALFQVASQFNTLEFKSEYGQPENGVGCYVYDRTQGPRCAMACAPGLVYRNYFLPFPDGTIGQRGHQQIDNLDNLAEFLSNGSNTSFWRNQNGCVRQTKTHRHACAVVQMNAILFP